MRLNEWILKSQRDKCSSNICEIKIEKKPCKYEKNFIRNLIHNAHSHKASYNYEAKRKLVVH